MFLDSIVVVYVLYVLGGFALMLAPFERKRVRSGWARSLLGASAVLLVVKGTVQLLRYYAVWVPSLAVQRGLPHTLDSIGGIVLGLLLALAFSGELAGRKRSETAQTV
jgi:hypothetical protein